MMVNISQTALKCSLHTGSLLLTLFQCYCNVLLSYEFLCYVL